MPRKHRCQSSSCTDFDYCEECFKKQIKIDQLKTENEQLRRQLRYRKKKDNQEYLGSVTPSSKLKFKENAEEGKQS